MDRSAEKTLETIKDKNVIVFDGECVLCSGFFNFVLKHDQKKQFHFLTAQSQAGEALYAHYGLKVDDYDTNLVLIKGRLFERLHGLFEVLSLIGWPWRILNVFRFLPAFLLDWIYYRIARNRYRLFGKRSSCLVPDATLKARFID
ncbi:MAG: DCC1-like thiol-disulfide oxidoreductase family protein [Pseudomonadota bacterium]